jgi:hypothetical protein
MFSKSIAAVLALVMVLGAFGLAFALGGGNYRKGKYLFRKNCRSCHAEGKTAKDLSPINFTQKEWTAIFTDKKPSARMSGASSRIRTLTTSTLICTSTPRTPPPRQSASRPS